MILAELSYAGPRPRTVSSLSSSWLAAEETDALEFILQTGRKRPLQHRRLPQQRAAWFQSQRLADKSKKRKEITSCLSSKSSFSRWYFEISSHDEDTYQGSQEPTQGCI